MACNVLLWEETRRGAKKNRRLGCGCNLYERAGLPSFFSFLFFSSRHPCLLNTEPFSFRNCDRTNSCKAIRSAEIRIRRATPLLSE